MLVSRDLDCTNTVYMQFSFKFIAKGKITVDFLSLLLYSSVVASQKRIRVYIFNISVEHQFMTDNMGNWLRFCIIPTLLSAYMIIHAVPKEKVNCGGVKNSTTSTVLEQKRNKIAQDFVEILHHVRKRN